MSRVQAYQSVVNLPVGVRVKLGGRLRLNAERLAEWLAAGGNLSDRAS